MRTINIYSKKEIAEMVKEELSSELNWIYSELKRLRLKLNDIEKIIQK